MFPFVSPEEFKQRLNIGHCLSVCLSFTPNPFHTISKDPYPGIHSYWLLLSKGEVRGLISWHTACAFCLHPPFFPSLGDFFFHTFPTGILNRLGLWITFVFSSFNSPLSYKIVQRLYPRMSLVMIALSPKIESCSCWSNAATDSYLACKKSLVFSWAWRARFSPPPSLPFFGWGLKGH